MECSRAKGKGGESIAGQVSVSDKVTTFTLIQFVPEFPFKYLCIVPYIWVNEGAQLITFAIAKLISLIQTNATEAALSI